MEKKNDNLSELWCDILSNWPREGDVKYVSDNSVDD
jgi:hypothetical protein